MSPLSPAAALPPQYFGGARDGERYTRPVHDAERLIVCAYDEPADAGGAQRGAVYQLQRRPSGQQVLAHIGPAPMLRPWPATSAQQR